MDRDQTLQEEELDFELDIEAGQRQSLLEFADSSHELSTSPRTGGSLLPRLNRDRFSSATSQPPRQQDYRPESKSRFSILSRLWRIASQIATWTAGPDPPKLYRITPILPSIQDFPLRLVQQTCPRKWHRALLLTAHLLAWLCIFSLTLHHSVKSGEIGTHGRPERIWCGATFWEQHNGCGLDGNLCRPFDNTTFAFRCPTNCLATKILNPRAVGDRQYNYQSFVVGGTAYKAQNSTTASHVYRGDSFICHAAIHSGIVHKDNGGCGVARLTGPHTSFLASKENGVQSIAFDSLFPKTFSFISNSSSTCVQDLRWPLLAITCIFTVLLSLCTTSAVAFFFPTFTMLFLHVGLVSDPPNTKDYPSLISIILGRYLPAAFIAVVIYHSSVQQQHEHIEATVDRTILWLGGAWIGSLNNYTFDNLPIQRLTPHDIQNEPGAVLCLIIIVLIIFFIALGQAFFLRQEGLMRRYLVIYSAMVAFLLLCVALPQLNLRIHHYLLALLLIPGTRIQNRPSMLYQGILVGLFINGVARWGFASILQTTADLREGGQLGSPLPNIPTPVLGTNNITFQWPSLPKDFDGISVIINDVERFRWYSGEGPPQHTFTRQLSGLKEYFRFGFMSGSESGDFTKAGVWHPNGTWTAMRSGASK